MEEKGASVIGSAQNVYISNVTSYLIIQRAVYVVPVDHQQPHSFKGRIQLLRHCPVDLVQEISSSVYFICHFACGGKLLVMTHTVSRSLKCQ